MPTVTAYGADYAARELMPWELAEYTRTGGYDLRFLIRHIGYPGNPRCVSHHRGALAKHRADGRLVLLYHQIGDDDFAGGHDAGRAHALAALTDARAEGYPEHLPFVFVCGSELSRSFTLATVLDYLQGAAEVVGITRTWCSAGADIVHAAQDRGAAAGFVLTGDESGVREGIAFHRSNEGMIYPGRIEAGLLKAYVDLADFEGEGPEVPEVARLADHLAKRFALRREEVLDELYRVRTNGVSA
ncbi:hypothetical protein [Saccharothrix deserti]|uniref:hypothetical protein n=1 Tax=Saccharothrix deserti TaxID=2593674 RepID=UPI00131D5006|nr:hypothetical protein [Saccharothrix deserti]